MCVYHSLGVLVSRQTASQSKLHNYTELALEQPARYARALCAEVCDIKRVGGYNMIPSLPAHNEVVALVKHLYIISSVCVKDQ